MDISDDEDGGSRSGGNSSGYAGQAPLLPTPLGAEVQAGDWGGSWAPPPMQTEWQGDNSQLLKVKRWMTEILLEVTTDEIEKVAHSVYNKARSHALKAPAKVLAKSSALASISTLGLGYGSGSSGEEESGSESSDDDSDAGKGKKPADSSQKKDRIFSDEDSDYNPEESEVPKCLRVPTSQSQNPFPFNKTDEAIPGLRSVKQESKTWKSSVKQEDKNESKGGGKQDTDKLDTKSVEEKVKQEKTLQVSVPAEWHLSQ
nr:hypothetical protein BaRGS_006470 [Batillaria attramentaria]